MMSRPTRRAGRSGPKQRVWFAVLLYTGLRRGDAVRLGRQHVRDGIASHTDGEDRHRGTRCRYCRVTEAIDHGPTGDLAFICGANGKPLTKESFRQPLL